MNDPIPSFDLDAYAARYCGRGKIQRLRFVASHAPELAGDALRLAAKEAKKGRDSVLYKDIIAQAVDSNVVSGTDLVLDENWVRACDQWAAKELEKLRHELEDYKQQENREVIRMGHKNLGEFLHERGKLEQARGEFIKTRDYCTQIHHNLEIYLKVITVSVEAGEFAHIEGHYVAAENAPDVDKSSSVMSKMRACAGIALLVRGSYADAALRFLTTNMETHEDQVATLQAEFGDAISLEDVATYGALCALATLDRSALKKFIIDRVEFRYLLELVPNVREILFDFYHTRYTRCLQTMRKILPDLMLDMYLSRDVDTIFKLIREKAIIQYVSPFLIADLKRMQKVFETGPDELEKELLELIERNDISARIDTQRHALHATENNERRAMLSQVIAKGKETFDDAEALLLRMTLMKHGLEISPGGMRPFLGSRGDSHSSVARARFDGFPG